MPQPALFLQLRWRHRRILRYGDLHHPPATALAFGIYYPSVIRKEQERLLTLFGDAYRNYCRNVPSFIPSLSRLKPPPAAYSVNPATFTHNIVDALWFIWFIGIFEFISGLHEAGMLPVWFLIP